MEHHKHVFHFIFILFCSLFFSKHFRYSHLSSCIPTDAIFFCEESIDNNNFIFTIMTLILCFCTIWVWKGNCGRILANKTQFRLLVLYSAPIHLTIWKSFSCNIIILCNTKYKTNTHKMLLFFPNDSISRGNAKMIVNSRISMQLEPAKWDQRFSKKKNMS